MSANTSHDTSQSRMNLIVFLLGLSVFVNYIDRSNLSIAAPLLKDELGISASQLGKLLSAFFWTYGVMQIPAGWLVDRFDVKWVFAAGFFLWSGATAVTGLLHGFAALILVRVILGIGESVAFPSYCKIFSSRLSETRRGIANAILMTALSLGPAVGVLVGGTVVGRFGWRPFFLALGLGGLFWLLPWLAWMPPKPKDAAQPFSESMGFLAILRQRSTWGTCLGQFCVNYYLYFLVTWLPFYLVRARHLSMDGMAKDGAIVFLMSAVSATICGKLSDRWIGRGATITRVRKGSQVIGQFGVGLCLVLTALTEGRLFVAMLAITGTFLGISICNGWAITQALAGPMVSGRWTGVQNSIGNLAGGVGPWVTGFLLDRTGSFLWPFLVTAAIAWVGALSWGWIVGPVEQVQWKPVSLRTDFSRPAANGSLP
jgi:MFS transporter, ACS family, D-galactonate transporter